MNKLLRHITEIAAKKGEKSAGDKHEKGGGRDLTPHSVLDGTGTMANEMRGSQNGCIVNIKREIAVA